MLNNTFQEFISMYLLKSLGIVHNTIFHILCCFFLILQITCAVVLFSFSVSYANEHGATVLTVPVTTDDFPDCQEKIESLLHHKTGLKKPRVYKYKAPKWCENVTQLTPNWLKIHYGTSPLSSVREESATQVQPPQYSLAQAIELIESDKCQDDVNFIRISDQRIANILKIHDQLSLLPLKSTKHFSLSLFQHYLLLCPLNRKAKKVLTTLPFNLWQIMLQRNANNTKKTKKQLSLLHKSMQFTFDKTSFTIPTHITFLEISNKHHVKHLHQNMIHVSNVIVQTHGQQKVVLMPPISKQHPYHHLLNSAGQFIFNKEIDFSASNSVLNNESRLAHTTLYSIHLYPGDLLLVPENWFIYRKSFSTSVSMSLNYFSGDTCHLFCFQAKSMQSEYFTKEKRAVETWANMAIQQRPQNAYNILDASNNIQATINDATQQVLDLHCLKLHSLPNAFSWIPHLKALHLAYNQLTYFFFGHMNNLVSLDVSSNQLLSFSSSHMPKLTSLNLTYNKLTSCSLSDMPKLASLDLTSNQLTSFSLSHMPKLSSLNLSYNELTSFSLSHMPKLSSLDVSYNELASFSLIGVEKLASLNLAYNTLTSFSLAHVEHLVSLNLASNQLTSFSFGHAKILVSLNLSYNKLNNFLIYALPSVTHIDLSYNCLFHLGQNCIRSISNNQRITLDLRDNPWSEEGITQIQRDLSQRLGEHIIHYPIWVTNKYRRFLIVEKIKHNAMKYENFLNLLSYYNIFPSPNNPCLQCSITLTTPCHIIFFMTRNKCYIIYDSDALVRWMHTKWKQTPLPLLNEEVVQDPSTREPITPHNLISAQQPHVLQYLQQKLGSVSTENIGLIHDPHYFISFFTQHLNELNEKLKSVKKDLIPIQTAVNAIKNRFHECLNADDFSECAQTLFTRDENDAMHTFAQQEDNNVTVILNFLKYSQENITNCALPLLQTENFNINTGPIDIASQSTMDGQTLREKRNQLFIKQLSLLTPPYSKERSCSICTPVMPIVTADFPSGSFESIQWEKKVSEIPTQNFFSALISTTQPMIKYLESMQKLLEQKIKISCDRLHKTTTKYPIEVENDQDTLLFQKTHDALCAKDASKRYLVEMYMTGVKIVLFMHNMKENIHHMFYRLQTYRSNIEDIAYQQTMLDAAQKLARHFKHQRHAIKEKSALLMTPLFDKSLAMFHNNIYWTQEELNEQLKNFARITWID